MENLKRPTEQEYAPYYGTYVGKVDGDDFMQTLKNLQKETTDFLSNLNEEQWNHRYAEGKWSVKEVMIHILDAERVFAYRALRIGRNDDTPLPGFEQNGYVPFYKADGRSSQSILDEYQTVRNATLSLFDNFSDEDMGRMGNASGHPVSVLGLGFIIAGHETHHMQILKERYGV